MAKKFKKVLCATLALLICLSAINLPAFAAQTINGNTWYGEKVSVDVTAGTDGYNYMALFRKYVHGYEFGGHFMGDGEGPQTFVVIDTAKYDGQTWTPDGVYNPNGTSNYDVLYCCDVETTIVDGTYYKRVNLEDSEYYSKEEAAKIRAILMNSYPYVSVDEMKEALAEAGFAYADKLTRNEIIAAVQTAVWCCANGMKAEDLRYQKSYKVSDNLQWGYPMHDTSNESGLDVAGMRVFKTYEEVGTRIDSLVDYLLKLEGVEATDEQIVITKLDIKNTKIDDENEQYQVTIDVGLNHGVVEKDIGKVHIDVYVNGELQNEMSTDVNQATDYQLKLTAKPNDTIKVVVSGTQDLARGVYFYAPRPADVDGDGIATSREVSQSLVGVSFGPTEVYAEKSFVVDIVNVDLELHKVNGKGEPLQGAKFTLHDENGKLLATQEVDEYGKLVFNSLLPGSYQLTETVAPNGYLVPTAPTTIVIHKDGTITFGGEDYAGDRVVGGRLTLDGFAVQAPDEAVTVELTPGKTSSSSVEAEFVKNVAKTIYAVRRVTVTMSEVEVESIVTRPDA